MNRRSLESLYLSFVLPCLEYAGVFWEGCTCTQKDKELFETESVPLAAARVVTGALAHTSHKQIYIETGWETLAERRRKQRIALMFKMNNGLAPAYLQFYYLKQLQHEPIITSDQDITYVPSKLEQTLSITPFFRQLLVNGISFPDMLETPNM